MSLKHFLATVLALSCCTATFGELSAIVNQDNFIILKGTGEEVVALDFLSTNGLLEEIDDPAPWEFLIANSDFNVALGNLGPAVVIDGDLATRIRYRGENPESDLQATWGNESDELFSLSVSITEAIPFSGFINAARKLVLVGTGEKVAAFELASPGGLLEPIPPGDLTANVMPFQVLLSNDPTLITIGNLGEGVVVDGELVTGIGYLGNNPEEELDSRWAAEGTVDQVPFVITREVCGGGDLTGDIDGNGEVGFTDFLSLSANFGNPGKFEQGDLDCDGAVDFPDFLILSRNFGNTSPAETANAPEPDSGISVLLGAILALSFWRRCRSK